MGEKVEDYTTSIIIPAYNSEATIIRALESIRKQTAIEQIMEVIVVNDGSKDNTAKLVNEYKEQNPKFPLILINKINGGVSTARNAGLKIAKGSWIALLDADDEWNSNKLQRQFDIIRKNPEIDFLGGNHVDRDIKILWKKITHLYSPTVNELCIKMFPQTSTVVFKRKIYDTIGGYDETRKYCEDGQFFLKICEHYQYYYLPEKLITFDAGRRGFGISGLSGNLKEMQRGLMDNFKELYERHSIGLAFYLFIVIFSKLKYIRRILICKLEK